MKIRLLLPLLLGCAFTASADDPGNADMNARVNLAAANAPGDLLSDAYEQGFRGKKLSVASRTIIGSLVEQVRVLLIPVLHGLHRRLAAQR